MTCRELTQFLSDYLAGELPGNQRLACEAHLDWCGACVRYLMRYRQAVGLGQQICPEEEQGADLPEELMRAIPAASRSESPSLC